MRSLAAIAIVLLAVSASAHAQQDARGAWAGGEAAADPYPIASPDQLIRQGIDRLLGFLIGSGDPAPQAIRDFVDLEIAPFFDFGYMAQWAAGPMRHRLTLEQRAALTLKLRALFLDALARNLGTLERPLPRVEVFPARPGRTMNEATVYARVLSEQQPPVRLEFRFYWSRDGWRVYDAVANGASAVAFYRSYFTAALRRHGPDVVLR